MDMNALNTIEVTFTIINDRILYNKTGSVRDNNKLYSCIMTSAFALATLVMDVK